MVKANRKRNMWSNPEKSECCSNVDKSEENTEEINILSIQTKESTSKSATIAPKVVGNNSKPTKPASKPKVEKLGWDTPLPPELAKEFQEWLNELKVISEYSYERYCFWLSKWKIFHSTVQKLGRD